MKRWRAIETDGERVFFFFFFFFLAVLQPTEDKNSRGKAGSSVKQFLITDT